MKVSQTVLKLQSGHKYVIEMAIFNVQRAITPKVCNPELWDPLEIKSLLLLLLLLWFLRYKCRLIVLNICVKFHKNILNGFKVTKRTGVCGKNCHFSMFKWQ